MKEIRIHARAGQGAITTASLFGDAVFEDGNFTYAFPHFGAARMGAPMNAFIRIDSKPIRMRNQVTNPDYVIVIDPSLMDGVDVFSGVNQNGLILINSKYDLNELKKQKSNFKIYTVDADRIATEIIGKAIVNTVLLGCFSALTDEFSFESLVKAIKKRFSSKLIDQNIKLATYGYEYFSKK